MIHIVCRYFCCIFERIFSVSGGWLEPPEALPGLITKSIWLASSTTTCSPNTFTKLFQQCKYKQYKTQIQTIQNANTNNTKCKCKSIWLARLQPPAPQTLSLNYFNNLFGRLLGLIQGYSQMSDKPLFYFLRLSFKKELTISGIKK